jgi:hypothetical protein
MTQNMIYIIPIVALIAILWSNRNVIKKLFTKGKIALVAKSEFSKIITKHDIEIALSFLLFTNHGKKQEETVFRNQGKLNSLSSSYKNIRANVFLID